MPPDKQKTVSNRSSSERETAGIELATRNQHKALICRENRFAMAGYVQKVQPHTFRLRIGRALGRLPKPHQPVPKRPSETAARVRARNRRNTRPRPAGNHCFTCVSQSPRTRQGRTQRRLLPRSPKGHHKRDGGQQ